MSDARILPAAVYDALKASAEQFGGIGADDDTDDAGNPLCAFGHVDRIDGPASIQYSDVLASVLTALRNDMAVERINQRRGEAPNARVSFDEWCAELRVVRGA